MRTEPPGGGRCGRGGPGPGLMLRHASDLLIAAPAVMRAGATYVPIDPATRKGARSSLPRIRASSCLSPIGPAETGCPATAYR
jgi:hypothetical protein